MTLAKKMVLLLLVIVLVGPILGCLLPPILAPSVGSTTPDSKRAFNRVVGYDARMMVDDLALFWQTDRPLRTSRWVID